MNDSTRKSLASRFCCHLPWGYIRVPAAIVLLLLIPLAIRTIKLAGVPVMDEPFDVVEFAKWDVPADQDAFTDYSQAVKLQQQFMSKTASEWPADLNDAMDRVVGEEGWDAANESVEQWLQQSQQSLAIWRRGTEKGQGRSPQFDLFSGVESLLEQLQGLRTLVRSARLEQAKCLHDGDLDQAWQWARAIDRCGGHLSYRACFLQGQTAAAFHATAAVSMQKWSQHPGVTSQQLKSALRDVTADYALYERPSNIFKSQYLAAENSFRSSKWAGISPVDPDDPPSVAGLTLTRTGYWIAGEPELMIRIMRQILTNQLAEIDKPLAQRPKLAGMGGDLLFDLDPKLSRRPGQLDPVAIQKSLPRTPLMGNLMPVFMQMDSALLRQAATQSTVEVMLAAQAYRRDHGEFPEKLSQLVPDYLPSVPLDAFRSTETPLLYRRDEPAKAVVWSVGANGVDDGAAIRGSTATPTDVGYELK